MNGKAGMNGHQTKAAAGMDGDQHPLPGARLAFNAA